MEKIQRIGVEVYQGEQWEKCGILRLLLAEYNDGRKKSLLALAVNLLELKDLREILEQLSKETFGLPPRERAGCAAALCREAAVRQGIDLRLRKMPGKFRK